jgi:hypothetical protein
VEGPRDDGRLPAGRRRGRVKAPRKTNAAAKKGWDKDYQAAKEQARKDAAATAMIRATARKCASPIKAPYSPGTQVSMEVSPPASEKPWMT